MAVTCLERRGSFSHVSPQSECYSRNTTIALGGFTHISPRGNDTHTARLQSGDNTVNSQGVSHASRFSRCFLSRVSPPTSCATTSSYGHLLTVSVYSRIQACSHHKAPTDPNRTSGHPPDLLTPQGSRHPDRVAPTCSCLLARGEVSRASHLRWRACLTRLDAIDITISLRCWTLACMTISASPVYRALRARCAGHGKRRPGGGVGGLEGNWKMCDCSASTRSTRAHSLLSQYSHL